MSQRFTIDGGERLEKSIREFQDQVTKEILAIIPESNIDSILLGGGYGRGEGGVFVLENEELPYNDFEYYIFVKGNALLAQRRYNPPLSSIGEKLGSKWNMHVDFKVASIDRLAGQKTSMFSYDLMLGNQCLLGVAPPFQSCEHHHEAGSIDVGEATRLMFNRCSGLLFASEKLKAREPDDADLDFINRNHAKASLAFGDSILCAENNYHWSCRERGKRLAQMSSIPEALNLQQLQEWHQEGVVFKLRPERNTSTRAQLLERQKKLVQAAERVWLWIESKRLGRSFHSLDEYLDPSVCKFPQLGSMKNRLINARTFGWGQLVSTRYPRERLYHALGWLLWSQESEKQLVMAAAEMRTTPSRRNDVMDKYEQLWESFG
jgi:hypothetical protein